MSGILEGKGALIVGGARGRSMGAAEARRFAEEGAAVIVADLLDERGEELVAEIVASGGKARYRHLDATNEEDWHATVAALEEWNGTVDILVNNVGISDRQAIMNTPLADWTKTLNVNATSMFLGVKSVVPAMRRAGGGSIVNIGSNSSVTGTPFAAYCASKWAVRGLGKVAALEFAGDGIRVNTLCPGFILTELNEGQPFIDALARSVPLGRAGTTVEIADLALYLASDASRYITGQDIVIDGGLSMPRYVLDDFAQRAS